jgi:calcineurin-like phosphoesterase family protein
MKPPEKSRGFLLSNPINMNIWIISDTHFNHAKMVEYCGRPKNFNDILIKKWNKVVTPDDMVIHLGDVILGQNSALEGILATLPGRKILCRGNHDHESNIWYMNKGFAFVCDYFVYNDLAFSHAPLTPLPNQTIKQHSKDDVFSHKPVRLNIHGHFHNGNHRNNPKIKDRYYDYEYYDKHRSSYHLITIEDGLLSPVSLESLLVVHKY